MLTSIAAVDSSERLTLMEETLDQLLESMERNTLFASCRFLLLGFEEESDKVIQLGKLIRRGRGTIYWELNEVITHLIVNDETEDVLR
jgi:hypothetical protein